MSELQRTTRFWTDSLFSTLCRHVFWMKFFQTLKTVAAPEGNFLSPLTK